MINQVVMIRHIKAQVKEEYMDAKDLTKMDDNKLLMQYFRKHDTDKNHKLDGLELLKAIAGMEGRYQDLCFIFSQLFLQGMITNMMMRIMKRNPRQKLMSPQVLLSILTK